MLQQILRLDPSYKTDGLTDSELEGARLMLLARPVQRLESVDSSIEDRVDGGVPGWGVPNFDAGGTVAEARERATQRKLDAHKKPGKPLFGTDKPAIGTATTPTTPTREDDQDPAEAARLRASKRAGRA